MSVLKKSELEASSLSDLHALASELGLEGYRRMRKEDLIRALLGDSAGDDDGDSAADDPDAAEELGEEAADLQPEPSRGRGRGRGRGGRGRGRSQSKPEPEPDEEDFEDEEEEGEDDFRGGTLDVLPNGSGFLRADPFAHGKEDVYVSPAQIKRCELRAGDSIEGPVRPPRRSERYPSLVRVESVNGGPAEPPPERPRFAELPASWATEKLTPPASAKDAVFGRGSRVAVGGPPGAGATTLLRELAAGLENVTVVLVGARPEEVTEWSEMANVTVTGGSFDRPADEQAQSAEMAIERGKRAVERGEHAVVIIDALDALPPAAARRVFGAARNAEGAGTLTVIAATGSGGELLRLATTRVVLDGGKVVSAQSGTTRADLLG
ncbi:MAG: Rho termination factor N-terminal domain-containing protein [Thermoleophilaceae bacterium]|nr:Rho termination factor N-terminal domain-containing protein [Thermoleophilaceae bacterium]